MRPPLPPLPLPTPPVRAAVFGAPLLRLAGRGQRPSHKSLRCFTYSAAPRQDENSGDPRIRHLGREIADDFARIRDAYDKPKYPIVLAHGLLGFSELRLAGELLPAVQYWFGIKDALEAKGIKVITTSVPASATIEERAARLAEAIEPHTDGSDGGVNIVAHSMGGLDARFLISRIRPPRVRVRSLVTIATPHHGSAVADVLMDRIGPRYLPRLYRYFEKTTGLDTGAFEQLTTKYMLEDFNPRTPDDPDVRYFSYGACVKGKPPLLSPFRKPHEVLSRMEGPNDGLVSVESSKWGTYKGTLVGLNHLDLINWTNRLRWTVKGWFGHGQTFNAIAFYLDIADMLAKEGL